jgi:hypothetical protein
MDIIGPLVRVKEYRAFCHSPYCSTVDLETGVEAGLVLQPKNDVFQPKALKKLSND